MKIKKIFILFTMLITGLSFKGASNTDKMVVADAAEVGSYAYLDSYWQTQLIIALINQGFNYDLITNLLITNDGSQITTGDNLFDGCPIEVGVKGEGYTPENYYTNGYAVSAYVYRNTTEEGTFDCILYADVETIYPNNGTNLFASLTNVKKITFDCNFSMAKAKDRSMMNMFNSCTKLALIEGIEHLDTTNVTDMRRVFCNCPNLPTIDVSHFDTSSATDISYMFASCKNLTTITGLENFKTSNVTNMGCMFTSCKKLETIDVSHFDTSNVTDMHDMFSFSDNLTTIKGLEKWNTSNVTDMSAMFYKCTSLETIDVSHFDTTNVTTTSGMFGYCSNLTAIHGLNGENWKTSNVTDMEMMFDNCTSLSTLDLSNFDLSSITNVDKIHQLISYTDNLTEIKVPKNLNGLTIELPYGFGMSVIDSSMEGMTIRRGSKEYNMFLNTVMNLETCVDYMQGPELQKTYIGLSDAEKEDFNTLTDADGVLLTEKIAYMCYLAEANTTPATAEIYMAISPVASQYLVVIIACLSLALIGGYYFIQKKKYAK